jgi:nitroreductase
MCFVIDIIFQRRSIRKYTDQPVEPEKIELLLKAAMAAPSAVNSQPWEFVVVTENEMLEKLRGKLLFGRYNAPVAITVCGSPKVALSPAGKKYWIQDCSAAIENILIAAVGLGLGTVWIGVYPIEPAVKSVRQVLNIPEEVTPLGVIYVGYPGETKEARTRYNERLIHWQQYEPRKQRVKQKNTKYQ